MKGRLVLAVSLVSLILIFFAVQTGRAVQGENTATGVIAGTVKSADGTPMEGVGVAARHRDKTYTTTVYTDKSGNYAFPPLDAGQYRLWAQTVGFEAGSADQQLAAGRRVQQNFSLKTTTDIAPQLSGTEWMASLPEDTPEDRRGKRIFSSQCTGCHTASFVLQNRFDEKGWGIIIDMMSTPGLVYTATNRNPLMQHYKKDLAAYLAKVRGPQELKTFKPHPRPSGDATQVVITEYDLPRPDKPDGYLQVHNGSDWSEGTPSRFEGRGPHDVAVDNDGMVWIADDTIPERTLAKLDPRTGKVTEYKLADLKDGTAVSTHSVVFDKKSNTVWATNGNDDEFISLDPKTGNFKRWPRPATVKFGVGGTLTLDLEGNPWAPAGDGAIKLDIATGKYSEYPAPTTGKGTYGIATDRNSNLWYSQPGGDRVVMVNNKTGDSKEVIVGPKEFPEMTQFDREAYTNFRANQNVGTPQMKAPRRGAGDVNGNYVWWSEFSGNQLLRIDIRDNSVKEYPMPIPYSNPYAAIVDKNHMVWINMISTDRVARFDPNTEKFTEYFLPTRGTEIRHIGIDDRPAVPEIWICYDRPNKIARLQLRTSSASATR
jgi:streptogramin lyase